MFNFDCDDNNCFQICLNGLSFFPNEMNNDTFVPENKNEVYFIPNSDLNQKLTNSNEYNKVNTINCSSTKIESTNDKSLFSVCSVENIKKIFSKNKNLSQINEKFQENDNIKEEEDKLLKRKRKRDEKNSVTRVEIKEENKTKRGRKRNDNSNRQEHNKNSSDNIIKKIKTQLFVYLLKFLNNMFKFEKEQKGLCKLDYKIINQMNKDNDIELLKKTLKDLFSSDISTKYISKSSDFNRKLIQKIIKREEEVKDYETVLFVLNMTFGEWFDLFRYKKDIKDIQKEYQQIDNIKFDKIAKSFVYVDNLLHKMKEEHDEKYFSLITFYIYNYEKWFAIKSPRKNKSQNI